MEEVEFTTAIPVGAQWEREELDLERSRYLVLSPAAARAYLGPSRDEAFREMNPRADAVASPVVAEALVSLLKSYIPNVEGRDLLASGDYEGIVQVAPVRRKESADKVSEKNGTENNNTPHDVTFGVVAGCAYRPHRLIKNAMNNQSTRGQAEDDPEAINFVELALFCVDRRCQGLGLGADLMQRLESRARDDDLSASAVFAYADLEAFAFFRRMQFSRTIRTPHRIWRSRIREYRDALVVERCLVGRKVYGGGSSTVVTRPRRIPCTSGKPKCYCRSRRTRAIEEYDRATMATVRVFCSAADATSRYNLAPCSVAHVCNGYSFEAGGHYFRYAFDLPFRSGGPRPVVQIDASERSLGEPYSVIGPRYASARAAAVGVFGGNDDDRGEKTSKKQRAKATTGSNSKKNKKKPRAKGSSLNGAVGECANGYCDSVRGLAFRWADARVHACGLCGTDADSARLMLCDGIDGRCWATAHSYCALGKGAEVPDAPWFCPACDARRRRGYDMRKAVPHGEPRGFDGLFDDDDDDDEEEEDAEQPTDDAEGVLSQTAAASSKGGQRKQKRTTRPPATTTKAAVAAKTADSADKKTTTKAKKTKTADETTQRRNAPSTTTTKTTTTTSQRTRPRREAAAAATKGSLKEASSSRVTSALGTTTTTTTTTTTSPPRRTRSSLTRTTQTPTTKRGRDGAASVATPTEQRRAKRPRRFADADDRNVLVVVPKSAPPTPPAVTPMEAAAPPTPQAVTPNEEPAPLPTPPAVTRKEQAAPPDKVQKKKKILRASKALPGADAKLRVLQANPKKLGSKSHDRFERYKAATTTAQYYALGGSRADLQFDLARGFVAVLADGDDDDRTQVDDVDDPPPATTQDADAVAAVSDASATDDPLARGATETSDDDNDDDDQVVAESSSSSSSSSSADAPAPAPASARAADDFWKKPVGTSCTVRHQDQWYTGTVLEYTADCCIIKYDRFKGQAAIVELSDSSRVQWR